MIRLKHWSSVSVTHSQEMRYKLPNGVWTMRMSYSSGLNEMLVARSVST